MPARLAPAVLVAASIGGCVHYRASPLDLDGHAARWADRDPASREVARFAWDIGQLAAAPPEPFEVSDGFSLREAEVVALFFNPRLRSARLKARVPEVGASEAGRWEDPELGIDGERILESVDEPWVLGGALRFTIPLSGRLGAERAKAFAEANVELLRAYVEETSVLGDLRAAWAQWTATLQRRGLVAEYLRELDEVLRSAEGLLRAGEIAAADVRLFRVERVTRRAELQALELEHRQREAAVKGVLGLAPESDIRLVPSLGSAVAEGLPDERRRRLRHNHPKLLLARAEYAAAEAALKLELRKQYPDLKIGGGYGTEDGQSRILFGAGLPLPLLNRNRRGIAEAVAGRDAARAAAEAGYEDLAGQLFRAELAAEAAQKRRQFIEREVVPLVDEQVTELRRLGRLGEFNTLVLLEALRTAFETKVQLLEAAASETTTANELNALAGTGVLPRPNGKDGRR